MTRVIYNKSMSFNKILIRATGYLMIFRAVIFAAAAIMAGIAHSSEVPSTINDVATPIIFTIFYGVCTVAIGIHFAGTFIGSRSLGFRDRLDSLTYSNYKNGSEISRRRIENQNNPDANNKVASNVNVEALEAATTAKKSRFFNKREVDIPSPRTVLVLLLMDLIITAFLMLSLPELPRIYVDMAAESLAIIVSFIAIVNEARK